VRRGLPLGAGRDRAHFRGARPGARPRDLRQAADDADGALGRRRLPRPDRPGRAGGPLPEPVHPGPARRRHPVEDPRPLRRRLGPAARRPSADARDRQGRGRDAVGGAAAPGDPARTDREVHRRPDEDERGAGLRRGAAPRGGAVRRAVPGAGARAAGALRRGPGLDRPQHGPARHVGGPSPDRDPRQPRRAVGRRRGGRARGHRRPAGDPAPDLPGGAPRRRGGRPGARRGPPRDRAADRPPVRVAAARARPGADRRGAPLSPPRRRVPRPSLPPLDLGPGPVDPGPDRGVADRRRGVLRPASGPRGAAARPGGRAGAGRLREPGAGEGRRGRRPRRVPGE
jgi:hypothetical protein